METDRDHTILSAIVSAEFDALSMSRQAIATGGRDRDLIKILHMSLIVAEEAIIASTAGQRNTIAAVGRMLYATRMIHRLSCD